MRNAPTSSNPRGGRERGQEATRARTAGAPSPCAPRAGLAVAASAPRSRHPHRDARITAGRRPPPSAPPAAARSSFAPSPPQLSGGRAGGEPRGAPSRGRGRGRGDAGASPDRRQRRRGRPGRAQSPGSSTASSRSQPPLREGARQQRACPRRLGPLR